MRTGIEAAINLGFVFTLGMITFIAFVYVETIKNKFNYRKDKELNGEFRLVKNVLNSKTSFAIERFVNLKWGEHTNLGEIDLLKAQKNFLEITKPFVTTVKTVI